MSYWKELSKSARTYSVGKEGWQVRVYYNDGKQRGEPKGLQIEKPWGRNKVLSDDLKLQMLKDRILAEASIDREDFQKLRRRIDPEDWDQIIGDEGRRGPALRKWLLETPTNVEFYNHLRYG